MADMREIGMTGLQYSGGYVNEEWLRELRTKPVKVYRQMMENDSVLGGTLYAITQMMRRTPRRVEPVDQHDEADVAAAEFCESVFGGLGEPWLAEAADGTMFEDVGQPWAITFEEILSYLPLGWCLMEEVYRKREDGKFVWGKLAIRAQESKTRWEFAPNGNVLGMWQSAAPDYRERFIPLAKAMLFRNAAHKGNPEGRSILRTAYRAWYFGSKIEEIEAGGIERELQGLPVVTLPWVWFTGAATEDQKAAVHAAKDLATKVRNNGEGGIVIPAMFDENGNKTYDFQLVSTQGRRAIDTNVVVSRYDQRKAMSVLADFILFGHDGGGNRSLGMSKQEMFATALEAHLADVADVLTAGLRRLLELNGMRGRVKVTFGQADRADLGELGKFVSDVGGISILSGDNEIAAALRESAGLPVEVTPPAAAGAPPGPPAAPADAPAVKSFTQAARDDSRERVAKDDDDLIVAGAAGADGPAARVAAELTPLARKRFLAAVEQLRGKVDLAALEVAIAAGDVEAAEVAAAVELWAAELAPVLETFDAVFAQAGAAETAVVSAGLGVDIAFAVDNARAVALLREQGARLVADITEDARAAVREILAQGEADGTASSILARRISRQVGISARDQRAVDGFRRTRLAGGATAEEAEVATARYATQKLEDRGETIAVHESLDAAGAARQESWAQAVEAGHLPADVRRRVIVTATERTCSICSVLDGDGVTYALDEVIANGRVHAPFHVRCRCGERLVFEAVVQRP